MSIIYADARLFRGEYKEPVFLVAGNEDGSPFRRMYRSRGRAEKFFSKMKDMPRVRDLFLVELPK